RVTKKSDLKKFIKLPYKLYKKDPNWVPHLLLERYREFDQQKNPFFEHAKVAFFLAWQEKKLVGRIAGIVNDRHNEFHNDKTGFFGFFECINDYKIAEALLKNAKNFLKGHGMNAMRGPMKFSTNDEIGFLISGFDEPSVIMMNYNPMFYNAFMVKFGMIKAKDVYAFKINSKDVTITDTLKKVNKSLKNKNNITIRKISLNEFANEVKKIKEIYDEARSLNWGLVPMTDAEIDHQMADMKQIMEEELVLIAEIDGEPAAFSLTLPNINEILIKIKNGRMFPWGFLQLLLHKNSVEGLRVITLGIKKKFEHMGLSSLFYIETIERAIELGYKWAEASWIPEDNVKMIRHLTQLGGKQYKEYRVYETNI
ncbi:MAG: N-acetyltransferase, partial [Calditrichia bacterium]|nr:N-acetyltransferase [Calditrichia bacterium]